MRSSSSSSSNQSHQFRPSTLQDASLDPLGSKVSDSLERPQRSGEGSVLHTMTLPYKNLWAFQEHLNTNAPLMRQTLGTNETEMKMYREGWERAKTASLTLDGLQAEADKVWKSASLTGTAVLRDLACNVRGLLHHRQAMDTALPWQEHTPGYNFFTYVALHDGEHGSTPADQTVQSKVAATKAAWDLMKAIKKNVRAERVAEAAASEVGIESAAATESGVSGDASQNSVLKSALLFGVGAAALLGTAHWIYSKVDAKSWA